MNKQILVSRLKKLIDANILTVATHIGEDTFIVFHEYGPNDAVIYHQFTFEGLPSNLREMFNKRRKDDKIGRYHILHVFDIWDFEI